jgi:hypothetical protein
VLLDWATGEWGPGTAAAKFCLHKSLIKKHLTEAELVFRSVAVIGLLFCSGLNQ